MKKIITGSIVAFLLLVSMPVGASAAYTFNTDLTIGSAGADVVNLQKVLNMSPDTAVASSGAGSPGMETSYFGDLTRAAVMKFQTKYGIMPVAGYVGSITRAALHKIMSEQAYLPSSSPATISVKSVSNSSNGLAAVLLSNSKVITWQTSGYPANIGVDINLLRKISDSPAIEYAFVRTIVKDAANDGQETWTPRSGESDGDLYVEVACSSTYQFKHGCQLSGAPVRVN